MTAAFAKLNSFKMPAPKIWQVFSQKFNQFQRSTSDGKLVFRSLCELFKIAQVEVDSVILGRIIQHGPDKWLLIDTNEAECGYATTSVMQSVFVRLVCEREPIEKAYWAIQDRLEEVGF